jgi:hypothetical protein
MLGLTGVNCHPERRLLARKTLRLILLSLFRDGRHVVNECPLFDIDNQIAGNDSAQIQMRLS